MQLLLRRPLHRDQAVRVGEHSFDDAASRGAAVTIDLRPQTDNTLQVIFAAPDSKESNPSLNDRWLRAYQRRMGR